MSATKCIVLIVDGMGDLPLHDLHGKTPLEAAYTPNLNLLASAGFYGQVDPIAPGVTPNTDSGTGMLMGMRPDHAGRLRRGPVEAAGAGCRVEEGDVAMRANFASVRKSNGELLVTDRRAGRVEFDVPKLMEILNDISPPPGTEVQLKATDQHRALLVVSGENLDANISDTDPGDDLLPAPVLRSQPLQPQAQRTADILNEFLDSVHLALDDHPLNRIRFSRGKKPANALITRGAGSATRIENIITNYGLSAAVVSGCNTVRGLSHLFGFKNIHDPAFTAKLDTDIEAKIQAALAALDENDMVFVHLKAPDLCAHDQNPLAKMNVLERFDAALSPLLERQIVVACAADHSTDSNTGKHTADPVPALLYTPDRPTGINGVKFGEAACRTGNMERQSSSDFLRRVLHAMGQN